MKGELLIATPAMGDPRFHHAVILICSHDENGAMGLVVNNVLLGLSFQNMVDHFKVPAHNMELLKQTPILGGGPVEPARGFILHKSRFNMKDTIEINGSFAITGTIDALQAIVEGTGPDPFLFALGYAGWTAGQLEVELQQNAWLTVTPDSTLIFDVKPEQKWKMALAKLGVDPGFLSVEAGQA